LKQGLAPPDLAANVRGGFDAIETEGGATVAGKPKAHTPH